MPATAAVVAAVNFRTCFSTLSASAADRTSAVADIPAVVGILADILAVADNLVDNQAAEDNLASVAGDILVGDNLAGNPVVGDSYFVWVAEGFLVA